MQDGALIADRYRVGSVIAETDLGVLVRARHVQLDDTVVVRILSGQLTSPRIAAKFLREARNSARIKSDHVARFLDAGSLDDGRLFVVMEDLHGETLDRVLATGEKIGEIDAVDFALETCEALAAAHAVGIVHRELASTSIFLVTTPSRHRTVKVLGFGTSRVADSSGKEEDPGLTVGGLSHGAPEYAAPETFLRPSVDGRADIWSVGVILFEMLTGRRPFAGTPEDVVRRVLSEPAPSVTSLLPTVSPALDAVVARCLAKRPEDRFTDVAMLANALAPFATPSGQQIAKRVAGRTTRTVPIPPLPNVADPSDADPEASLHRLVPGGGVETLTYDSLHAKPRARRSRVADVALAIGAVAALAGAVWVMRGNSASVDRTSRSAPITTTAPSTPAAIGSTVAPAATTTDEPKAAAAAAPTASAGGAVMTAAAAPTPRTLRRAPSNTMTTPSAPPLRPANDDPWGWKR